MSDRRKIKIEIELKTLDGNKLSLRFDSGSVTYLPESREIKATIGMHLSFPKTSYRYGFVTIEGEPLVSEYFSYILKEPKDLEAIRKAMVTNATNELNQIKSEVQALFDYATTVTIDLNEVMDRIAGKVRPA